MTNYQRNVRKDETNVPVFVAMRDIPAGTSGADVERKGLLEKSEIVRRNVVPGAISNPEQVAELVADAADLRGRAGLDPPLRDAVPARDPRPAEGRPARHPDPRRPAPVARRHAAEPATRSTSSPRSSVGAGQRRRPRHADRPPRPRGAARARRRRRTTLEDLAGQDGDFAVMLKVTDTQVQKLHWVFTDAERVAPRAPPGHRGGRQPGERRELVLGAARGRAPEAARRSRRGQDPGRR